MPYPVKGASYTRDPAKVFDLRTDDGLAAARQKLNDVGLGGAVTVAPSAPVSPATSSQAIKRASGGLIDEGYEDEAEDDVADGDDDASESDDVGPPPEKYEPIDEAFDRYATSNDGKD